jgi:hypothetical protein
MTAIPAEIYVASKNVPESGDADIKKAKLIQRGLELHVPFGISPWQVPMSMAIVRERSKTYLKSLISHSV